MQKLILVCFLFMLNSCQPSRETSGPTGSRLLQKTIAYHDPGGNWQQLKARLYFSSADTAGQEHTFEIEVDNNTGYFSHISRKDGKEIVKGIARGKEFFLIDGKQTLSGEDREKYDLTSQSLQWTRNFYMYLYGLPMKLTDTGTMVVDAVSNEKMHGKDYQMIQVNYDAAVGKDTWFFYLAPETAAMQAYRFHHGTPDTGEYILLDQELTVDGIKIPKVRKWYLNKDDKYLGTDTLLKAEALSAYRI